MIYEFVSSSSRKTALYKESVWWQQHANGPATPGGIRYEYKMIDGAGESVLGG